MSRDELISRLIAAAERLIARGEEERALVPLLWAHQLIECEGEGEDN